MELFNLKKTNTQKKKRVGRGIAAGQGKTAGRGQKGQKSRSSGRTRPGFEGGQTPLYRRIPKFGFTPLNPTRYTIIDFDLVNKNYKDKEIVSKKTLIEKKLIKRHKTNKIKLLANGKLTKKVTFEVDAMSKKAKEIVEKIA